MRFQRKIARRDSHRKLDGLAVAASRHGFGRIWICGGSHFVGLTDVPLDEMMPESGQSRSSGMRLGAAVAFYAAIREGLEVLVVILQRDGKSQKSTQTRTISYSTALWTRLPGIDEATEELNIASRSWESLIPSFIHGERWERWERRKRREKYYVGFYSAALSSSLSRSLAQQYELRANNPGYNNLGMTDLKGSQVTSLGMGSLSASDCSLECL